MHLWPLGKVYSALQDPLAGLTVGCKKRRKEKEKNVRKGRGRKERDGREGKHPEINIWLWH